MADRVITDTAAVMIFFEYSFMKDIISPFTLKNIKQHIVSASIAVHSANTSMLVNSSLSVSLVFNPVPPVAVPFVSPDYAHNQRITDDVFIRKVNYFNLFHFF